MSFERHRQIYQSDGPWAGRETSPALEKPGATLAAAPGAHRLDEFAAGYSLAGCSPAEPASASPARAIVRRYGCEGKAFAVNSNLSLLWCPQQTPAVQSWMIACRSRLVSDSCFLREATSCSSPAGFLLPRSPLVGVVFFR